MMENNCEILKMPKKVFKMPQTSALNAKLNSSYVKQKVMLFFNAKISGI